ncbi:MAG: hypothetical protein C4324_10205 [Blastocatellia bacterium]
MSTAEETIRPETAKATSAGGIVDRAIDFLSSVRLGVFLLVILIVLSMIGMLIIQQNVQGFDAYYASLTPAEKIVFGYLGFFDIYHTWYFNFLLLLLSLNIVLASIDRFPTAWSFVSRPKKIATDGWLLSRSCSKIFDLRGYSPNQVLSVIVDVFRANRLETAVTETESVEYFTDNDGKKDFSRTIVRKQVTVFGQKGKFNRIGAYIVHIFLLLLFLGHFIALQTGFDADVRMIPGNESDKIQMIQFNLDKKEKFDVQLPFSIACLDIEQKLIDPRGGIDVSNTLDWRTRIKISDPEYGETIADVALNKPFHYRGYRFFQAQTIPVGNARSITLQLTSQADGSQQSLRIPRLGSALLADGTKVEYEDFLPDFAFNGEGKPDTKSGDYRNPVALLGVTPPGGQRQRVFAFAGNIADNIPVGAPKFGYKWRLTDYEKAPFAHVLSIKYDPYNGAFIAWYFGGFGLVGALAFVFFTSHRRIWSIIEETPDGTRVIIGGEANRNQNGFEQLFAKIEGSIGKNFGIPKSETKD